MWEATEVLAVDEEARRTLRARVNTRRSPQPMVMHAWIINLGRLWHSYPSQKEKRARPASPFPPSLHADLLVAAQAGPTFLPVCVQRRKQFVGQLAEPRCRAALRHSGVHCGHQLCPQPFVWTAARHRQDSGRSPPSYSYFGYTPYRRTRRRLKQRELKCKPTLLCGWLGSKTLDRRSRPEPLNRRLEVGNRVPFDNLQVKHEYPIHHRNQ